MHLARSRRHLTRLLLAVMVLLFPVWPAGAASPPVGDDRPGQLAASPALTGLVQVVLREQAPSPRVTADRHVRSGLALPALLGLLVAAARFSSQPRSLTCLPRSLPSRLSLARPGAVGPRAPPPLQLV